MKNKQQLNLPYPVERTLKKLGQDITLARKTRNISQADLALRSNTSVSTIKRIEEGFAGTALHNFLRVLHILGRLDAMQNLLALEKDELALDLIQENLPKRIRSQITRTPAANPNTAASVNSHDELEGF